MPTITTLSELDGDELWYVGYSEAYEAVSEFWLEMKGHTTPPVFSRFLKVLVKNESSGKKPRKRPQEITGQNITYSQIYISQPDSNTLWAFYPSPEIRKLFAVGYVPNSYDDNPIWVREYPLFTGEHHDFFILDQYTVYEGSNVLKEDVPVPIYANQKVMAFGLGSRLCLTAIENKTQVEDSFGDPYYYVTNPEHFSDCIVLKNRDSYYGPNVYGVLTLLVGHLDSRLIFYDRRPSIVIEVLVRRWNQNLEEWEWANYSNYIPVITQAECSEPIFGWPQNLGTFLGIQAGKAYWRVEGYVTPRVGYSYEGDPIPINAKIVSVDLETWAYSEAPYIQRASDGGSFIIDNPFYFTLTDDGLVVGYTFVPLDLEFVTPAWSQKFDASVSIERANDSWITGEFKQPSWDAFVITTVNGLFFGVLPGVLGESFSLTGTITVESESQPPIGKTVTGTLALEAPSVYALIRPNVNEFFTDISLELRVPSSRILEGFKPVSWELPALFGTLFGDVSFLIDGNLDGGLRIASTDFKISRESLGEIVGDLQDFIINFVQELGPVSGTLSSSLPKPYRVKFGFQFFSLYLASIRGLLRATVTRPRVVSAWMAPQLRNPSISLLSNIFKDQRHDTSLLFRFRVEGRFIGGSNVV